MSAKSIYEQFRDIEKDVNNMARHISKELSKEVVEDLKDAHKQIMKNYYDAYTPSGKNRYHRTKNLMNNSIIPQSPIDSWDTYDSGIVVGSFGMHDNYNISPDNVFDLMWNKGVRGLPKVGTRILDNGEKWQNPFWKSKYGERGNIFRTSITIGSYTTKEGTPAQVMADITNHWKEANGEKVCKKVIEKIKDKYR